MSSARNERNALMLQDIVLPALVIKGSTLTWCADAEELVTCTPRALKNRWFEQLLIMDSAGNGFKVAGAAFARKTGRKAFKGFFAPRLIQVELSFERGSPFPVSLDEIRRHVTRAIRSDRGFWESSGDDVDALLQSIARASSPREVWDCVRPHLTSAPSETSR